MLTIVILVGGITNDSNFLYILFKFQILLCLESEKYIKLILKMIITETETTDQWMLVV